jgi:hypothetical protein
MHLKDYKHCINVLVTKTQPHTHTHTHVNMHARTHTTFVNAVFYKRIELRASSH